jgi:hypothetical protein
MLPTLNNANTVSSIEEQAYYMVTEIVQNLETDVLKELAGGYQNDVDTLLQALHGECIALLTNKMPKAIGADSFMYLDRFNTFIDIEFKKRDINYFTMSVFPEFDIDWHTIEWGHFLMYYPNLVFLAARGRGKSFFFSYVYPLWKAFRYTQKTSPHVPLQRVYSQKGLIITASEELAMTEFVPRIVSAVETNPFLYEHLMPSAGKGSFNKKSLKFKNGTSISIKGYGGEIRGRHPDWVVCDDVLTENQLYSKDARDKAYKWFMGTVRKLVIRGQTIVVGTPFHEKDLYGKLKSNKHWKSLIYPAIYPDGRILASRRFNYRQIKADREELGAIFFSRELLCKPVSGDSTIFPYEIMSKCLRDNLEYRQNLLGDSRDFVRVVMGCDLAISANVGADYSVFITVGVTTDGARHILNIWREKGASYEKQKAKIKSLYKEFNHDLILIESNQFQIIFQQQLEKEGLPVHPHITTKEKNLKYGLPSLAPLFERQKYVIPYETPKDKDISDTLLGELSSVAYTDKGLQATGTHDDMAMALYITEEAVRKNDFDFLFV